MSMNKNKQIGVLAILVLFVWAVNAHSQEGGVTAMMKQATAPITDHVGASNALEVPKQVVLVGSRYQDGQFWAESRKDKIERFACSQCHNNKPVTVTAATQMAHGQIVLNHGGIEKPLSCFTCHARDERDLLVTESGITVDMDHGYALCGQCHFRQKKDWIGGAHGKRISNWAGKRVVMNCTSCHDPHAPRFQKRWPKTYSPPLSK